MLLNIYPKTKRHGFTMGMLVTLAMMASCAKTTSLTSHQEVWKYLTVGRITSTPLAYNGSIYFGSDDHKLYSIHAKTGKANWSYQADSPIRSNPQTSQAAIIFQSNAGTVYALDAASGDRKWSFSTNVQQGEQDEWDYYDSSAAIDNDSLYIGSADSRLYALNANMVRKYGILKLPVRSKAHQSMTALPFILAIGRVICMR
jgi:outer membrane protein assembly factor BamB